MTNANQKYHIVLGDSNSSHAKISTLLDDFSKGGEVLFKKRNTVKKLTLGEHDIVVKAFKKPSFLQALIYGCFRKSKARRAFENATELLKRGIQTPEPIAFAEQKKGFRLIESYYICRFSDYDFDLSKVLQHFDNAETSIELIRAFTEFTFTMHERDILHIDHNQGNTLIKKVSGGYSFTIIDINRMQFKSLTLAQRLNNFVRLTDDIAALNIIADTYAEQLQAEPDKIRTQLHKLKQKHLKKVSLKKRLKKLLKRQNDFHHEQQ